MDNEFDDKIRQYQSPFQNIAVGAQIMGREVGRGGEGSLDNKNKSNDGLGTS